MNNSYNFLQASVLRFDCVLLERVNFSTHKILFANIPSTLHPTIYTIVLILFNLLILLASSIII